MTITCFKCGKVGHKAFDCWTGKGGASVPKVAVVSGGVAHKIVCYTCGEEGHKSPQCPRNVKGEKAGPKDLKPKPVKRIWGSHPSCVQLEGEVNGHVTAVLLDSGAAISVVPESLVAPSQLTGDSVAVKPFGARKPMLLPTAELTFKIGGLEWVEGVAVSPRQEGVEEEVLYSLDLQSQRGWELVLLVNKVDQKEVLRVTTSGGFKGWPGVAWPPHFKSTFTLNSSTTGMNCTDLYRPSEVISPTSLLCCPLSSLYVCRATPPDRVIHALLKP